MDKPTYNVFCAEGGGMRGLVGVEYCGGLVSFAQHRFGSDINDFGKLFDLIVGTSTGAIFGSGLAAGISLNTISRLYTEYGEQIFPAPLPEGWWKLLFHNRAGKNKRGAAALEKILKETFGDLTLLELYQNRGIGLIIPSVNCTTHQAWVFKTPHDPTSNGRDNNYTLVDACMASSAAPVFRSLAAIRQPETDNTYNLFADGGLWANNPVLVALIEALRNTEPDTPIQIFCLGTLAPPVGSVLDPNDPHWGVAKWGFGSKAVEMALDSQTWVSDQMIGMLIPHLDRQVKIIRFPQPIPSAEQAQLLGLDNASKESMDLLKQLAVSAIDQTNQLINNGSEEGQLIQSLLTRQVEQAAA